MRLDWATASERSNAFFAVERSADGYRFAEIGRVAGHGDSDARINYRFYDESPVSGVNYYRLRQTDYDGTFEFSPVRVVRLAGSPAFTLYPSPAKEQLFLTREAVVDEPLSWQLVDLSGRLLREGVLPAGATELPIGLGELPGGMFVIRIVQEQQVVSLPFIKS